MTIAKVRNLSKFGVLADVDPYNLPPEAFSMAVNARFLNGSVWRAPVFRRVPLTLAEEDPRFLTSNLPTTGFDDIYIGYLNGKISLYDSSTETDVSVFGYVAAEAESPYTSCHNGDVLYINRSDRVPWSLKVTDTDFQNLANWDSTWRAHILRSSNSALCAFGITKGADTFPSMIKTSEFAEVNTVPTTWDETDPTNNATENILGEMEGGITEAQNLGDGVIVYGLNETWTMVFDGSDNVWAYEKVFNDAGCLNANCAIELDRQHYVFGPNDIWKHDGVSKTSICDLRVRKFIFSSLNLSEARRCFVKHDPIRKELRFNYVSGDQFCAFLGGDGCNRSAVFNLTEQTWTFDDLPFVFGATFANLDINLTYATVTETYEEIGSTYLEQEDGIKRPLVMIGDVSTEHSLLISLYAVDEQGPGSLVPYEVDTDATRDVLLIKEGIDLDELPDVADLRGYKVISSIYPQARFETDAEPLNFSFGSADHFNVPVVMGAPQTYDGITEYQCDHNEAGRYLRMEITHEDHRWFQLSGIDLDIHVDGAA